MHAIQCMYKFNLINFNVSLNVRFSLRCIPQANVHACMPTHSVDGCYFNNDLDEETGGYEYDPDYIEQAFFEPATREEELLQQIVELKVENIPEKDVE